MFDAEIEGLAELEVEWQAGCAQLDRDLETASFQAAKDGVESMKDSHPYTDRTGNLTGSMNANALAVGAEMRVEMPYAGFVDKGTSRNRPYPFTPLAERTAENSLNVRAAFAAEDLAAKMNR